MKIFAVLVSLILCVSYSTAQIITGTYYFENRGAGGFDFSSGDYCSYPDSADITYSLFEIPELSGEIIDMGDVPFDSVVQAPTEDYVDSEFVMYNHVFVVRTMEHHYAKMDIFWGDENPLGAGFLWAYQPDGSTNLRTSTIVEDTRPDGYGPKDFELLQNYPNPFNPTTSIRYQLPAETRVTIGIYNLQGQLVAKLVDERQGVGLHTVDWHAGNLASGLYLCRMQSGSFVAVKKMMLLR